MAHEFIAKKGLIVQNISGNTTLYAVDNRVAINTDTPLNTLHVDSDDNDDTNYITINSNTDKTRGFSIDSPSGYKWSSYVYDGEDGDTQYFGSGNSDRDVMVMQSGGRVGINIPTILSNIEISSIIQTGTNTYATVTSETPHKLSNLSQVRIQGSTVPKFNGIFSISTVSTFAFRITGLDVGAITENPSDAQIVQETTIPAAFTIMPQFFDAIYTFDSVSGTTIGSGYTDITSNMRTSFGTPDVILPNSGGSYLYIGKKYPWRATSVDIHTASVGTSAIIVEYSSGSSGWTSLTTSVISGNALVDGTNRLRQDGNITWDLTTFKYLWTSREIIINSNLDLTDNLYWIRISLTGTITTSPTSKAISNHGIDRMSVYAQSGDVNPFFKLDTLGRVGFLPPELESNYSLGRLNGLSTSKFEVIAEDGTKSDFIYYLANDTSAAHPAIIMTRSGGVVSGKTAVSSGMDIGALYGYAYDGITFRESSKILFESDASAIAGSTPGRLTLWTTNSAGTALERMRIDRFGYTTFSGDVSALRYYGNGSNLTGVVNTGSTQSITGQKTFSTQTIFSSGITLSGYSVNNISNDSGLINNSQTSLVTEYAVKNYTDNQLTYYVTTGTTQYITGEKTFNLIDFNTGSTITNKAGRLFFDKNENTLSYNPITPNNDVTINIGQEEVVRIYNNLGYTILNGQSVHIMGSIIISGISYPTIALPIANNTSTMYHVCGIATHDIQNGQSGFITKIGLVHDLNLSGFTNGDEVYLSDTTSGGLMKYSDLNFKSRVSQVGWIINNDANSGILYVSIDNEGSLTSISQRENNILTAGLANTGIYDWSGLTFSANTFSVYPMTGWIVDNTTNPTNPTIIWINFTGVTNVTTPYLTTDTNTYLLVNSASTLFLQNSFPTPSQRRDNIYLGRITHVNFINISSVSSEPDVQLSPMSQVRDMFSSFNFINNGISTLIYSTGLSFRTSSGSLYRLGINWVNDEKSPTKLDISAQIPATFQYRTQHTGGTFTNTTTIDPGHYDVNDSIVAFTGSTFTNQRIYIFSTGLIRVQYGQVLYNNMANAVDGIETESFITYPAASTNGQLIGILCLRRTATNLSDSTQARFIQVSKFGESLGGSAGISNTTLQQAYDNSSNPEIITNSTLDGVQIKGGTGSDTDANLIMSNNAGDATGNWLANGNLWAQNISSVTFNSYITTGTTQSITGNKTFYGTTTINSGITINKSLVVLTGLSFDNSNGTLVTITSPDHGLPNNETIIITGTTNSGSTPNGTYQTFLIDSNSFSILVTTNTSGTGTLNYTRYGTSYIIGNDKLGQATFDTSLSIKDLIINQNQQKGGLLNYAPNSIFIGQGGGLRYYWVGGTISPGDTMRTIDRIGYVTGGTIDFVANETVIGGISGSTAKVIRVDGYQSKVLLIDNVSGPFYSGETISGLTSGAIGYVEEYRQHTPCVFKMVTSMGTFGGQGYIEGLVGTLVSGDTIYDVTNGTFSQIGDIVRTGNTLIQTDYVNKMINFGNVPSTTPVSFNFTTLDDYPKLGVISEGQNAGIRIGITGGNGYFEISRNGASVNFWYNNSKTMQINGSANQLMQLNNGNVIFNYAYLDNDFIIRKLTSGEAYRYDAGTDTHTFSGRTNIANGINISGLTTIVGGTSVYGTSTFNNPVIMLNGLTVSGTTTFVNTENLNVRDNLILINSGETGSGVTLRYAGIEVDRGSSPRYGFYFDEVTQTFRVGQTGQTQSVATREDVPLDGGVAIWNASNYIFETVNINNNFLSANTYIPSDNNFLSANTYIPSDNNFLSANTYIPADNNFLSANTSYYTQLEANSNFLSANTILTANSLSGLTDVNINNPSSGQVLTYDGSVWINSGSSGGDLSNYYTKTETNNNFLSATTIIVTTNMFLSANTYIPASTDFLSANTSYYTQLEANSNFLSANTVVDFNPYVTTGTTQDITGIKTFTNVTNFTNDIYISGSTTIKGDLIVTGNTQTGILTSPRIIIPGVNVGYTEILAYPNGQNITYILPANQAVSGNSTLINDGNGNLEWSESFDLPDGDPNQVLVTVSADTLAWQFREYPLTFEKSISRSGNTISLLNDLESPGNNKLYGTYTGGTKGWYDKGDILSDINLINTNWIYFGDQNTDGTFRMGISSGNFVVQKRESGVYNTKGEFS